MNDNVVVLTTELKFPDMNKVLAAASTYSMFWQKRTFEFLPLLHTSVERHYKGFFDYVEELAKNAEVLAVSIESESVEQLHKELEEDAEDAEEEAIYLAEIQRAANNIGKKLDVLLAGVEEATKSIASLPVYDATREHASYLKTQEGLHASLQTLNSALSSKRNQLTELDKALGVLEADGFEKEFAGKLPTVEQIQGMVAKGAATGGTVVAVEEALAAVGKLMGGIQDGMRYSELQDQRRALQAQVTELVAEQREKDRSEKQLSQNIELLEIYTPLIETRSEWLSEKNKIRLQLEAERNKLNNIKLNGAECVHALIKLLAALLAYVKYIVVKYRESL